MRKSFKSQAARSRAKCSCSTWLDLELKHSCATKARISIRALFFAEKSLRGRLNTRVLNNIQFCVVSVFRNSENLMTADSSRELPPIIRPVDDGPCIRKSHFVTCYFTNNPLLRNT